ncbi:hypothetical protein OT109_11150 [Phycisphaeraceae bacterium D3-23]
MPERECGSCTACCTVLAIEPLSKPAFSDCAHACGDLSSGGGCAIYADRPDCCRDFACLWLQGHMAHDDRPDKLGVVFTTTGHPELGMVPLLLEVHDGAVQRPKIKDAVRRLLASGPVAVATPVGGKLIRPTDVTVEGKSVDAA